MSDLFLKTMTKLEFLWITDNKLQQISNSGDAMKLKYVHLERNRLSNLNLDYFQNSLKRLYLDHNLFTDASPRTLGPDNYVTVKNIKPSRGTC